MIRIIDDLFEDSNNIHRDYISIIKEYFEKYPLKNHRIEFFCGDKTLRIQVYKVK